MVGADGSMCFHNNESICIGKNSEQRQIFHFFWGSDFQKVRTKCLDTCSDIHCSYVCLCRYVCSSLSYERGLNIFHLRYTFSFFLWLDISMAGFFQLGSEACTFVLQGNGLGIPGWVDAIVKGMPRNLKGWRV